MQEYLSKIWNYMERFQGMGVDSLMHLVLFGGIAAFGVLNVLLGYRLLRFWMMLGGFAVGSGLGYLISDMMELPDQNTMLAVSLGTGAVLGLIAFFVYKAGIFMLGAGIGLTVSVYVLHPTTSASFFICILAGMGLGVLGVKFARPVAIVATSIMGGILAGIAISKLGSFAELPYGLLIGVGLALLGMLIQFATNKPEIIEVIEDDDEPEVVASETGKANTVAVNSSGDRKRTRVSHAEFDRENLSDDRLPDQDVDDLEYDEYEDDLYDDPDEEIRLPWQKKQKPMQ